MCGIVYAKSFVGKPVARKVIDQYLAQRHRGSDGFGFYVPDNDQLTHNVREGRILSLLRRNKGSEVLFHHRFPTSTANVRNACHPFSTKEYFEHNYVVVHNGVLWNEDELKKEHEKLGIEYVSKQASGRYNDSEALAYDIGRFLEGQVDKITAAGTIAFIAVKRDKQGNALSLHFGRNNGNPLHVHVSKKGITISSEGRGEMVEPNRVYHFEYATKELTFTDVVIPQSVTRTYSGNYSGYGYGYDWEEQEEARLIRNSGFSTKEDEDEFKRRIANLTDDELSDDELEIKEYNEGFGVGMDTRSYFLGQDPDYKVAERSYVKFRKDKLMHEAYEDAQFALELGEEQLTAMKTREAYLKVRVDYEDSATDAEVDEYCSIGDDIYYLQEAVDALRLEALGNPQMGFRLNPETINQQ